MPKKTANLQLTIYTEQDGETSFNDYWKSINLEGDGTVSKPKSAFQIIDKAVKDTNDRVDTVNTTIQSMQQTIAAMPDEIYNRIAKLITDAMEGDY